MLDWANSSNKPANCARSDFEGVWEVDFVIADVATTGLIQNFISVEMQAVDQSGSVYPAYEALINNQQLEKRPRHGVNWANVLKRYINQIINKGVIHHHWQSRMVCVVQLPLYEYFRAALKFDELDPKHENSNVVFMAYDYETVNEGGIARHTLKLCKAVGTSHNSLMMSALYRIAPTRDAFCSKITERLSIANGGLPDET